jgi:Iron-containing redox enzyme
MLALLDTTADARLALQRQLAAHYRRWFRPTLPPELDPTAPAAEDDRDARRLAEDFVRAERTLVAERAAAAPRDPEGFVAWFEALRETGAGQGDRLFPWLATKASLEQLRWFLRQEVAGEAGFEDLLALTQVKLPERAKLEMARNFWDEMGRGHAGGMHGPMLSRLAQSLDVVPTDEVITAEPLALGNLMMTLATTRHYAYHSVGALGVIELTAPGRSVYVNRALARLGVTPHDRQYFALHATLDKKHSKAWNAEVLASLAEEDPRTIPAMAEGALMRLEAGARCFARYRRELGV